MEDVHRCSDKHKTISYDGSVTPRTPCPLCEMRTERNKVRALRDTALQTSTDLTVEVSEIAEEAIDLFRALKKYGDHLMPCDCENGTVEGSGKPCSCGYAKALAGGEGV